METWPATAVIFNHNLIWVSSTVGTNPHLGALGEHEVVALQRLLAENPGRRLDGERGVQVAGVAVAVAVPEEAQRPAFSLDMASGS